MRLLVILVVCAASTVSAQPQPESRSAVAYSTQIRFDRGNVPAVAIGLMEGQKQIRLRAAGGLRVLTEGPGGTEVLLESRKTWTATIEESAPAVVGWKVEVERHRADDMEKTAAARKAWKAKQVEVETLELGSVFGFFGKVMDTREVLLVTAQKHTTRADAQKTAEALASTHGVETSVMPFLEKRPHGRVVLTDGDTTIHATDIVWLSPVKPEDSISVEKVEFGKGFSWHGFEDRRYTGLLYLAVDRQGLLSINNQLPAEKLLRGLVPAEIYPSAPPDALKAQAVSARGELLAKVGHRHLADPYHLCSDVHCQVYAGLQREDERTSRAVKETAGEMLFLNERLVDTVYSASCGGHTEHNEHVWGTAPDPALRGRPDGEKTMGEVTDEAVRTWVTSTPDSFCGSTRYGASSFRWKKKVMVDTLRKGMRAQNLDAGVVRDIRVLQRGVSGRAIQIEVSGSRGKVKISGELWIRKALGGLKSSLFTFDTTRGPSGHPVSFHFVGAGFGHGVGMCQTGAIGRATAGQGYKTILGHYYGGASVERIY